MKCPQILEARERPVEHHLLGDIGKTRARRGGINRGVDPADERLACGRLDKVQKEIDGRRLAGAVGAKQAKHLARRHDQI